jgi:hypothetical protein
LQYKVRGINYYIFVQRADRVSLDLLVRVDDLGNQLRAGVIHHYHTGANDLGVYVLTLPKVAQQEGIYTSGAACSSGDIPRRGENASTAGEVKEQFGPISSADFVEESTDLQGKMVNVGYRQSRRIRKNLPDHV